MPSPKPEPTQLKVLKGNPGKRPLPKSEPTPAPLDAFPAPPAYVADDPVARDKWSEGKGLASCGILTTADLDSWADYCLRWAEYRHALDAVRSEGRLWYDDAGKPSRHPAVITLEKARDAWLKVAGELGLTPSARTRVQRVEQAKDEDPFGKLRNRA